MDCENGLARRGHFYCCGVEPGGEAGELPTLLPVPELNGLLLLPNVLLLLLPNVLLLPLLLLKGELELVPLLLPLAP